MSKIVPSYLTCNVNNFAPDSLCVVQLNLSEEYLLPLNLKGKDKIFFTFSLKISVKWKWDYSILRQSFKQFVCCGVSPFWSPCRGDAASETAIQIEIPK